MGSPQRTRATIQKPEVLSQRGTNHVRLAWVCGWGASSLVVEPFDRNLFLRSVDAHGAFSNIFTSWIGRGFSHIYLSVACSRCPSPWLKVFLMYPPSSPALQRLHRLDGSSPDFHDQLQNAIRGEEYVQCEQNLEGDDLVWLVDYLDEVRRHVALPHSPLKPAHLGSRSSRSFHLSFLEVST